MIVLSILVGTSVFILLAAAAHDIAFRTIPNWMSAMVLLFGGCIRMLDGRLLPGLLTCALIFLGTGFCWHRGWLGGGDVKLLTACGLLVPPSMAPTLVLDVAVSGGVLALLYLLLGHVRVAPVRAARPVSLLRRVVRVERHRIHHGGSLPYASAIAAGALLALSKGH